MPKQNSLHSLCNNIPREKWWQVSVADSDAAGWRGHRAQGTLGKRAHVAGVSEERCILTRQLPEAHARAHMGALLAELPYRTALHRLAALLTRKSRAQNGREAPQKSTHPSASLKNKEKTYLPTNKKY